MKIEKRSSGLGSARFAILTGSNSKTFSPMSLRMWGERGKIEREPLPIPDNTRMTDGIRKGTGIKNVPATHLLRRSRDVTTVGVTKYVAGNHDVLK